MEKALNKIPFEIKKIKFALEVVKKIKRLKMIFKIKQRENNPQHLKNYRK